MLLKKTKWCWVSILLGIMVIFITLTEIPSLAVQAQSQSPELLSRNRNKAYQQHNLSLHFIYQTSRSQSATNIVQARINRRKNKTAILLVTSLVKGKPSAVLQAGAQVTAIKQVQLNQILAAYASPLRSSHLKTREAAAYKVLLATATVVDQHYQLQLTPQASKATLTRIFNPHQITQIKNPLGWGVALVLVLVILSATSLLKMRSK